MVDRMDRVAEAIKREVSSILLDEVNDPRVGQVTITRVEVTRDLRQAKIYYITYVDKKVKDDVKIGLKRAGSFVRGELGRRISMKFTPKISFREDREYLRKEAMDDVFKKIENESEG